MDLLARVIADIWSRNNLVSSTVTVQAKAGSGGAIAWSYVSRKTGDGHYLAISGPTLLSNDILNIGDLSYKDVTPIAQLFTEYTCFVVNADGPIKTGNDLVAALKSPKPPSVGVAAGSGRLQSRGTAQAREGGADRSRQVDHRSLQRGE